MRVLLVDDDDSIRHIISLSVLNMNPNAEIVEAASGNRAIKLLQEQKFDIVISDYSMPDGTGGDVFSFMSQSSITCPFFLVTSECFGKLREFRGCSDEWKDRFYLQKPVSLSELVKRVDQTYGKTIFDLTEVDENFKRVKALYFLRYNKTLCDVYLKLSPSKLVRIISKDSVFDGQDIERYLERGISNFHIRKEDLSPFQNDLSELPFLKLECDDRTLMRWEKTHRVLKLMIEDYGISPTLVAEAEIFATSVIAKITTDTELRDIFDKTWSVDKYFYDHSYLTMVLSYGIMKDLKAANFQKSVLSLTLASLFHDIGQDISELAKIENIRTDDFRNLVMEDKKAYLRGVEKSKDIILKSSLFDREVKLIIEDFFEGVTSGGASGRQSTRSYELISRVFIIAHDFVNALYRIDFNPKRKKEIMNVLYEKYQLGEFKVIYDSLVNCHDNPMDVIF